MYAKRIKHLPNIELENTSNICNMDFCNVSQINRFMSNNLTCNVSKTIINTVVTTALFINKLLVKFDQTKWSFMFNDIVV